MGDTFRQADVMLGSGNVFRDLGEPDADRQQLKAILAAEIIGGLDQRELSTRAAGKLTGIAHSEFVRIRKPDLKRFTCDRLIEILNKLGQQVEVAVSVTPKDGQGRGIGPAVA